MEKSQRVRSHTRKVDGKTVDVGSYSRRAQWARAKSTWISAGFSTLIALGIVFEAGITLVSTLLLVLIAVLGVIAVIAGRWIEQNRRELGRQHTRRTGRASRTTHTTRTTRPRTSRSRGRGASSSPRRRSISTRRSR